MQDEERTLATDVDEATKPYADLELYVANEAYSTQQVRTVLFFSLIIWSSRLACQACVLSSRTTAKCRTRADGLRT